jgi:hypothetical protein
MDIITGCIVMFTTQFNELKVVVVTIAIQKVYVSDVITYCIKLSLHDLQKSMFNVADI